MKQWLGFDHFILTIRKTSEFFNKDPGPDFLPGVKVSDEEFSGVQVRVYEASGGEGGLKRGILYFHGGGWALGSTSECT